MSKKVSVLMTVYNAENDLEASIESILNQSYQNLEFIIVNDGSTDNSEKVINHYMQSDSRIKFINRSKNKGRVYSLNEGLRYCSTNYIFINDSDDISKIKRIEKTLNFYESISSDKNQIGAIGTASNIINTVYNLNKEYYIKTSLLNKKQVPNWIIYMSMPFIHSSVMYYKPALIEIGGFPHEVTSSIDHFTIIKLSRKYKIFGLNEIMVNRIINGNNYFMQKDITMQNINNKKIIKNWKRKNIKYSLFYDLLEYWKDKKTLIKKESN